MSNLFENLVQILSTHVYEAVFITFLFILLLFTVYSVYFLFFEMPKVKGKKNQDFVTNEVAEFSEYYKKALKEEFDKISVAQRDVLSKTSESIINEYKALIADEGEKTNKSISTIFSEVKAEITAQMNLMKKEFGNDELNLKKMVEQKLQESLNKANSEMDEYKKARMKKLDDSIMESIKKVSEEVLSKSLNINEHKQLIFEALEQAKKEGVFNG